MEINDFESIAKKIIRVNVNDLNFTKNKLQNSRMFHWCPYFGLINAQVAQTRTPKPGTSTCTPRRTI